MRRYSIAFITLLLLGGCSIGPTYVTPSPSLPHGIESHKTMPKISLIWWDNFHNPALSTYVNAVIEYNFDLKSAEAQSKYYLALFNESETKLLPSIGANATMNRTQNGATKTRGQELSTTTGLTLAMASYEIDLWNQVSNATTIARLTLLNAEINRQNLALTLSAEASIRYFTACAAQEIVKIQHDALRINEEMVTVLRQKVVLGAANEADLALSEVGLANARALLVSAEKNLISSQIALRQLSADHEPPHLNSFMAITLPSLPSALSSVLLERRPDIALAENNLRAVNAQIGIAKAALYPKISLTGSLGFQSPQLSSLFSSQAQTWSLSPALYLPLFNRNGIKATIRAQEAKEKELVHAYEKAVMNAFLDAQKGISDVESSLKEYNAYREASRLADNAYTIAQKQYELGAINYLALLTHENNLLAAKRNVVNAKMMLLTAQVTLYKILGGGWEIK